MPFIVVRRSAESERVRGERLVRTQTLGVRSSYEEARELAEALAQVFRCERREGAPERWATPDEGGPQVTLTVEPLDCGIAADLDALAWSRTERGRAGGSARARR